MSIPQWPDLPEEYKQRLKNIAGSFGATGDKVDAMTLPTEEEAFCLALEMYTLSRAIIETLGEKADG